MKTRYTGKSLETDVADINLQLEALGSEWRLSVGYRNGYTAVDKCTVEQLARHCCQCCLEAGTPRECKAASDRLLLNEYRKQATSSNHAK
jgi:hypothetical protein